jgi:preprotein translocase subunit SecE
MKKVLHFVQDSIGEMKKVVWPSREEVTGSTKVVLVSTVLFALVLGIVDFVILIGIDVLF